MIIFHVDGDPHHLAYYKDEVVVLDGYVWLYCTFFRCTLIRNDPSTQSWFAVYEECKFYGTGWPSYMSKRKPHFFGPDAQFVISPSGYVQVRRRGGEWSSASLNASERLLRFEGVSETRRNLR
jgi:hypothetical protein